VSFEKDPGYWQALGEFIETFASAELMLFTYLYLCAGINKSLGRALFGGLHVDQIIQQIRRIWAVEMRHPELKDNLEEAIKQFATINTQRNVIIHHASFVTSDKGRITSTISRARQPTLIREVRVSLEILKEMTTDLSKISDHLVYATCIITTPNISRDDLAADFPALTAAWRYTPPGTSAARVAVKRRVRHLLENSHLCRVRQGAAFNRRFIQKGVTTQKCSECTTSCRSGGEIMENRAV
jgi:hypothetical protein